MPGKPGSKHFIGIELGKQNDYFYWDFNSLTPTDTLRETLNNHKTIMKESFPEKIL